QIASDQSFHWTQRGVEANLFICQLAFLLAKILELKLAALPATEQELLSGEAGRRVAATRARTLLRSLKVAQDRWQDWGNAAHHPADLRCGQDPRPAWHQRGAATAVAAQARP